MWDDDIIIRNHRKAEMTFPIRQTSPLGQLTIGGFAIGCLALASPCAAGEYGSQLVTNATRCSAYGPEFTAVEGSDVCARIGGHVRVQLGTNAGLRPEGGWNTGRASSAALRSGNAPSQPAPSHLRIQGGLEYPNPFR